MARLIKVLAAMVVLAVIGVIVLAVVVTAVFDPDDYRGTIAELVQERVS